MALLGHNELTDVFRGQDGADPAENKSTLEVCDITPVLSSSKVNCSILVIPVG